MKQRIAVAWYVGNALGSAVGVGYNIALGHAAQAVVFGAASFALAAIAVLISGPRP